MDISFDSDAKAVYVYLTEVAGKPKHLVRSERTDELEKDSVFIDRDAEGKLIGIEILSTDVVTLKAF